MVNLDVPVLFTIGCFQQRSADLVPTDTIKHLYFRKRAYLLQPHKKLRKNIPSNYGDDHKEECSSNSVFKKTLHIEYPIL